LFPEDRSLEDRYVIGKALAKTDRIVYDTAPLYHYRIRGDSMSRILKMSELNTDADIDFCEYATGIYPGLKNLTDATLIYDHITCVQNYLLYFKGTENDSEEMRDRYRMHMDFIKEHAGDKNPEISKKLRLKIFMTLHMQWFLSAFTKRKTERIKRQNEVYTKPVS
jgi:hypothetical protein